MFPDVLHALNEHWPRRLSCQDGGEEAIRPVTVRESFEKVAFHYPSGGWKKKRLEPLRLLTQRKQAKFAMLRQEPLDDGLVFFRFERAGRVDHPSSRMERGRGIVEQAKLLLRQIFQVSLLQLPLDFRMPPQGPCSAARRIHQDAVKGFLERKGRAAVECNP